MNEPQPTTIQHGSSILSAIFCAMRKHLYGRDFDKDTFGESSSFPLSNDTLPLIRRSNTRNPAFGAIETGTANNLIMPSSFHLIDDNNSGGDCAPYSASVARGDDESKSVPPANGNAIGSTIAESSRSWILLQKGRIILLLLSVVYGSLNISMRLVFARPEPPTASAASTIQGWFAAICFLPLLWKNHSNKINGWRGILAAFRKGQVPIQSIPSAITTTTTSNDPQQIISFWRFALELAFFNFGTQALINMSLLATQGARASFLVQMSVVFTPVVSVFFGQQNVSKRVWIACFVALAGLFVLSYSEDDQENNTYDESTSSSNDSASLTFTWGDWCCLLAALCWSLYIFRLSAWGEYFDETTTQFVKNIALAVLYSLWMLVSLAYRWYYYNRNDQDNESDLQSTTTNATATANANASSGSYSLWLGWKNDPIAWLILFYSALGPCTIADVFQQKAQSSVPAAEANVILSLEPVFTTLLGFLLLGEIPPAKELCGGLLIMIASFVASCGR